VVPLLAKDIADLCGTYVGREQREMFLHRRQVVEQERERLNRQQRGEAAPDPPATISQDVGQIAVIDDLGGVIARRNAFNLDRRTLSFTPSSGGYQTALGDDTFDTAASQNGAKLEGLGDDDTRAVNLPFSFRFFGTAYNQVWVNSNGTLTFGTGDLDANAFYGHFVAGPPVIAGCFTDLDPSVPTAAVQVLTEATRVVVTWFKVPLVNSKDFALPPTMTFQIRLYPGGRIEIAYRSTNQPNAIVGITAGNLQPVTLVDFASTAGVSTSTGGIAETFSALDSVDIVYAAQRFYQTHEDAYDYLVLYNAENVAADAGVVAYELTARSQGEGYGDDPADIGADFGSKRRLRAVMNMGPLGQYPVSPNGLVASRSPIGDTPLTLLGHESGHLFLAFVSVPDPAVPGSLPMLGKALAHWAFPFNSEASFLEGNRIVDRGAGVSPRFRTTGTVEGYSPLDQYLMGFRTPEEVPPTFVVLNSGQANVRSPQIGVEFNGTRLDVKATDLMPFYGRRTPDSTVAQRRFRFAFVMIVPAGSDLSPSGPLAAQIAQVDRYRNDFEAFYANAASQRASAETSFKRAVTLSLAPAAGVLVNGESTASIELTQPAAVPVSFTLRKPSNVLLSPATVTIPAGSARVTFSVFGGRMGVEEFSAEPSDAAYETAVARVQVNPAANVRLSAEPGAGDVAVVLVSDQNKLPYGGARVNASTLGGGSVDPSTAVTGASGRASFNWSAASGSTLVAAVDGVAGGPVITPGGVVNGASFGPRVGIGAYVTIFGERLAGARVRINGVALTALFASDKQINFLSPATLSPGPADVSVETPLGISMARVEFNADAPGIFLPAAGFIQVTAQQRATLGFYATGAAGASIHLQVDGAEVRQLFPPIAAVFLPPPGVQLFFADVPPLPPGTHTLSLIVNGITSNTVKLQAGPPN